MSRIVLAGVLGLFSVGALAQQQGGPGAGENASAATEPGPPKPEEITKIERFLRSAARGDTFAFGKPPKPSIVEAIQRAEPPAQPRSSATLFAGEEENRAVISWSPVESLSLAISSPWNDDGDTQIASLDGLAGARHLELSYTPVVFGAEKGLAVDVAFAPALTAMVGYDEFEYFDASSTRQSERKDVWSASVTFSVRLSDSTGPAGLFVLGYTRESDYEDAADSEGLVCTPLSPTTQKCEQGFLAPPARKDTDRASLQFRLAPESWPIGLAPRVAHDFHDDVTGFELPVFLVRGKGTVEGPGPFTGGVKFGWRSDTDDFTAGVFVGAALTLWD